MDSKHLEIFLSVAKWFSIPLFIRLYISLQSLKIYGIYQLYSLRKLIKSHEVFKILDSLYSNEDLFNSIYDTDRKELFTDIFKIEVLELATILISFRDIIYSYDSNVFRFIYKNKDLSNENLVNYFLRLHRNYRDKVAKRIRIKLKSNGVQEDTISYIVYKFFEFTSKSSFRVQRKLEILKNRRNIFFAVLDIFDELRLEVEINLKYLPLEFNSLNGKLDNLNYKKNRSV